MRFSLKRMIKSYYLKIILIFWDYFALLCAVGTALLVNGFDKITKDQVPSFLLLYALLCFGQLYVFRLFNVYNNIWKYASVKEYTHIFIATLLSVVSSFLIVNQFGFPFDYGVLFITWILTLLLVIGIRVFVRLLWMLNRSRRKNKDQINAKRILIVGGGYTGSSLIKQLLLTKSDGVPVAVIDDDPAKHNMVIHGVPVVGGREKITEFAGKKKIDEIIIATPSASKSEIKRIVELCARTNCIVKTMPLIHEMPNYEIAIERAKEVNILDLLGRDEIQMYVEEISGYLSDEVVLVTGGGGSIGSELCRQIAGFSPKLLIIFDIYENNAFELQNELRKNFGDKLQMKVLIGSVRDTARVREIFETYHPKVIFHAAAHKHVPLMEDSPREAIKNNIFGTYNVAKAADMHGASNFVLISTDKAVNPTNIMGATKRIAEMIIQHMSRVSTTKFVAVRFGNVLGSNGSVIPTFKQQIAAGGPLTVTHPDITRYFMTIPEAARLVVQAGAMAQGGEIFILDMGEPVKIIDLAKDLISLSGFRPDIDIKIEYTGLRPGEKMYEELFLDEEGRDQTRHEKIFIAKPVMPLEDFISRLEELKSKICCECNIEDEIRKFIVGFRRKNETA